MAMWTQHWLFTQHAASLIFNDCMFLQRKVNYNIRVDQVICVMTNCMEMIGGSSTIGVGGQDGQYSR